MVTAEENEGLYGIEELATLGGVSRRTVRYYVQRGLIPAPLGTGRGKHYGAAHLEALLRVKSQQEQGLALAEIAEVGGAAEVPAEVSPAEDTQAVWTRVRLAEGVELHLEGPGRGLSREAVESLRQVVLEILKG